MATESVKVVDPDNGTGTDYTSLSAWEAGEQKNLVTADEIAVAKCRCTGGTADTTATTIVGWTTGPANYVKIWTDPAESYRHAGKWTTGNKYRIEIASGGAIDIQEEYVRLYGLQLTGSAEVISDWTVTSGTHYFGYLVVKGGTASIDVGGGGNAPNTYTYNCVFYDYSNYNAFNYVAHYIYNTTIRGNGATAGIRHYGANTTYCKNCAVFDNVDDFAVGGGGTNNVDYCASDDGDGTNAVDWDGGATDWANVFADYSNGDYTLNDFSGTGKIIGMGTDDPGSGLYSDDIIGNARSGTWDIGAFEYVSAAAEGRFRNYPSGVARGVCRGVA